MREQRPVTDRRPGCLQWAVALPVLALLSLPAVAVRALRSWRRGSRVMVERRPGASVPSASGTLLRLDLLLDLPAGRERGLQRRLTDVVVRVAEALRRPDDVYHLVHRRPELEETALLPVGPQVQELGERFALALGQADLEGRTVLWLTLGRQQRPAAQIDPLTYDPEGEGEPERLVARAGVRWAMASARAAVAAAMRYRIVLWVPQQAAASVEELLARLEHDLLARDERRRPPNSPI